LSDFYRQALFRLRALVFVHFHADCRVVNAGFNMIATIAKIATKICVRPRSMLRFNTEDYHDRCRIRKRPRGTGSDNDEVYSDIPITVTTISGELSPYNSNHRRSSPVIVYEMTAVVATIAQELF